MRRRRRSATLLTAALCAAAVGPAALSALGVGVGAGSSAEAGAALQPKVALPQAAPTLPAGTAHLGAPPSDQVLSLDVSLAGQDPGGLAQAVTAVSTPGSPDYHHYLSASQFAAEFGPSSAEIAQASSALRGEGLTVGTPEQGSNLLPVSGTAATVAAAFATGLEQVQAPSEARATVNTSSPEVPSSLSGIVTGVVGLNGVADEHSMLRTKSTGGSAVTNTNTNTGTSGGTGTANSPAAAPSNTGAAQSTSGATPHAVAAHAATPQACGASVAASGSGTYTATQMAQMFGLDQLFGQGRTGIGQTIAIVEFEQYSTSDFQAFQSCYGLSNSIRNVVVDGGPSGPQAGEAALDTEMASFSAPSAALVVYEAPNSVSDVPSLDLFSRIASDDTAQVVTTSWGECESLVGASDLSAESQIFQRMAMQGQTVIAASGDAGSEDCFNTPPGSTDRSLAVDDPGSQADVLSAGGTALPPGGGTSGQTVWNTCAGFGPTCAFQSSGGQLDNGAGGGGYSSWVPRPSYQGGGSAREVPDFSYPADPNSGSVTIYWQGRWTQFGGTSVGSPANAGLFADTNQGCFSQLGMLGPNLYAHGGFGSPNFTDITSGENDFTQTNGNQYTAGLGFDAASGLGTPVDQNLAIALQGADGCPSVASVVPNSGPVTGSGAITIIGGGFANATSVNFGSAGAGRILSESETSITVIPPNAPYPACVYVTVANSQGVSAISADNQYDIGGEQNCGTGYRFVASDGGVFDYGTAGFWGSTGAITLNKPVVGMATTPSTNGYWLVASDGGIFAFGDAPFYGSTGNLHLNKPIVGIASTPSGGGYWLVASDGGIFAFGSAPFFGSTGNLHLNKSIVGMASTPNGGGYWLVASDGGIFAFGNAQFYGSTGNLSLNSPVVGMASTPNGGGYWLVAADGGIFAYGNAQFWGSAGNLHLNKPVVGMAATPDGNGYWLVASDGGIFAYGDAPFYGSTGNITLNKPIVGMSSS